MNKQRHIFIKKISLRTFPDFLIGPVRLLSKNLKSEKKVKTLSLWAFILLAGPACLIYMVQE